MPELSSNQYKQNDNQNTNAPPNGLPTGSLANLVSGTIRALMGAVKRFYDRSNPTVTSTGTASAYALTSYDVPPEVYVYGEKFAFKAHVACGASPTLRIGGLQPFPIVNNFTGNALKAGEIAANMFVTMTFNGEVFRFGESDASGARLDTVESGLATTNTNLSTTNTNLATTNTNLSTLTTTVGTNKTAADTAIGTLNTTVSGLNDTLNGVNGVVATKLNRTFDNLSGPVTLPAGSNKGTVTSGTVTFNYPDGNYQTVTVNGSVSFSFTNVPAIGGCLQVNISYVSGTLSFSGTPIVWDLGSGEKATAFTDIGASLAAGRSYRISVENVNGTLCGVFM